jgi:pimeloyl-ACP methyl ester carboxylesterase
MTQNTRSIDLPAASTDRHTKQTDSPSDTPSTPRRSTTGRVRRRIGKVLVAGAALVLLLAVAGAVYEAVASTQDAARYQAPGRLVDVGGYHVHVLCMGEGSPTVLLDAWAGGWSTEWTPVQPVLARTTRVCAWDRAGSGWSDPGLHDHTPLAYAAEMDAVLRSAEIQGPYVLVAASYGGRVARLYANQHPDQVAGLVLVDAVHEDAFSPEDIADSEQQRSVLAVGNWILSRLGVARLLGPRLVPLIDGPAGYKLPEATRELIAIMSTRPKNQEGNARLGANHQVDDVQLRAAGSLGDRPLVVLSSIQQLSQMARWNAGQTKLASLSSRTTRVIADGSHLIAWEHPDLVVSAVQCVLAQTADASIGAAVAQQIPPCRDTIAFQSAVR